MKASLFREVPVNRPTDPDANTERLLRQVVRLNVITTGVSFGVVAGLALFISTLWLVLKGGPQVGKHLILLVNYFPGYRVTFLGSFIGLCYGFLSGFFVGSVIGGLYNYIVHLRQR
jgi:hypothetical protein